MIYAQVKDNKLTNIVVISSAKEALESTIELIRIDHLNPIPKIGWVYDGYVFMPHEWEILK